MDDVEGKSKRTNKNEKAQSGFYDPLGDGVVHDAETAPLKNTNINTDDIFPNTNLRMGIVQTRI